MKLTSYHFNSVVLCSFLIHVCAAYLLTLTFRVSEVERPEQMISVKLHRLDALSEVMAAPKKKMLQKHVELDRIGSAERKDPAPAKKIIEKKPIQKKQRELVKKASPTVPSQDSAQAAEKGSAEVNAPRIAPVVMASYEQAIVAWLEKHKRYPKRALRRGISGEVFLRIALRSDGSVVRSAVEKGSGHDMLDEEVLAMVKRATPFPAIPVAVPVTRVQEFLIPIGFQIQR